MAGNRLRMGRALDGTEVAMSADARKHHLYICGQTGSGKSKLVESLARQDLLAWSTSRCGMLVIDPHGALFDGLVNWLAFHGLKRPLVPIDLRQEEWVVAYNLIRRRTLSDPAVVIRQMVDSMAHVWQKRGVLDTPRLSRWGNNSLSALYELGFSLLEAELLFDRIDPRFREHVVDRLASRSAASEWRYINSVNRTEFESQLESTINRLHPFLQTKAFRRSFGIPELSLDFGRALEEGQIVLVCLATERNRISETDAALFGTLLLNDLWSSARERGKNEPRGPKPFYAYIDEAQNFVTPTIAKGLDQARGFGLCLTLANQFPGQFLHEGPSGQQLYDSIFVNARNKVVFSMDGRENLQALAESLFMGTFSPDKIKDEIYSTKVMGFAEETRTITSRGGSKSSARAVHEGFASGAGTGGTTSFAADVGTGGFAPGDPTGFSESESEFGSESESTLRSEGESESWSETEVPHDRPVFGQELSSREYESIEEQTFRAMAVLHDLRQRHCVVKLMDQRVPAVVPTPTVAHAPVRAERKRQFLDERYAKLPFALRAADADRRIAERERAIRDGLARAALPEPTTAKRALPKAKAKAVVQS